MVGWPASPTGSCLRPVEPRLSQVAVVFAVPPVLLCQLLTSRLLPSRCPWSASQRRLCDHHVRNARAKSHRPHGSPKAWPACCPGLGAGLTAPAGGSPTQRELEQLWLAARRLPHRGGTGLGHGTRSGSQDHNASDRRAKLEGWGAHRTGVQLAPQTRAAGAVSTLIGCLSAAPRSLSMVPARHFRRLLATAIHTAPTGV